MTTRLQVLFPDDEIAAIREAAARRRITVAAWVRETLREAVAREAQRTPTKSIEQKLRVLRESARYAYEPLPSSANDVDQLEALLTRLDGEDPDAEAAWDAEIARRLEAIRSGQERLIPSEDVFAAIRRKYGW